MRWNHLQSTSCLTTELHEDGIHEFKNQHPSYAAAIDPWLHRFSDVVVHLVVELVVQHQANVSESLDLPLPKGTTSFVFHHIPKAFQEEHGQPTINDGLSTRNDLHLLVGQAVALSPTVASDISRHFKHHVPEQIMSQFRLSARITMRLAASNWAEGDDSLPSQSNNALPSS